MKYAAMLAEKMRQHGAHAWLINTGWTAGGYGTGSRMKLAHTRAIIDGIHSGELERATYSETPVFGLHVPGDVPGVPREALRPEDTWSDKGAFRTTLLRLGTMYTNNFEKCAACLPALAWRACVRGWWW